MSRSLFIDRDVLETRVAVIEHDRVAEILIEPYDQPMRQGEVRQARVTHINHDIQAATVDAGQGLSLFLRAQDARVLAGDTGGGKRPPIGQMLKRGQNLPVQIGRAGVDGKQARCSADIALAGRYQTFHPLAEDTDTAMMPRPRPDRATDEMIAAEQTRLRADWQAAAEKVRNAPGALLAPPGLLRHALTHLSGPDPEAIMVPDRGLFAEVRTLMREIAPDIEDRLILAEPERTTDLDDEIERALASEVALKGGGRLTLEPTRALLAVDVDGPGKPLETNLAAMNELARQLRLRGIGGVVAVDLVSMGRQPDRKKVETALRQAVRHDPEPVEVGQIDRFGILTLVRRRSGTSLTEQLLDQDGTVRPRATLARLLRRAQADLRGVGPVPMTITLSQVLASHAPADLAERLQAHLTRPLEIAFDDRPVHDVGVSRRTG